MYQTVGIFDRYDFNIERSYRLGPNNNDLARENHDPLPHREHDTQFCFLRIESWLSLQWSSQTESVVLCPTQLDQQNRHLRLSLRVPLMDLPEPVTERQA